MGFFSDVGHALTGTKTDAQNRSVRENEERAVSRSQVQASDTHARAREQFGDGALSLGSDGGILTADGRAVSDAEYESIYGQGMAAQFKSQAATLPNSVPTGADNAALQQGQNILAGQTPAQQTPAPPKSSEQRLAEAAGMMAPLQQGVDLVSTGAPRATGTNTKAGDFVAGIDMTGTPAGPATPAAPKIDRAAINKNLGALNTYQNALFQMSQDNTGLSAAEAQLNKATELARIQAGVNTQSSQSAALGQARSARNRGDRGLLERQAIGEAGYIGQDAARTAAADAAKARGDLSILRATEEKSDRDFKLNAIKEAANLGLNTSALELDISKANLASVTNQLNNDAAFKQLGLQLDEQHAQAVMGFTRDMAALQFQYDQMSVQDQQETDKLMMQKYGIDEQTSLALKQMKAASQTNWTQVLTGMLGGAVAGGSAIGAAYMGRPSAPSDERVKTNVREVEATAAELDDFMGALTANTYEYKQPEKHGEGLRFGFMAQDLEKTKLGRHMVKPVGGVKMVEIAPLAFATASGLALVHERLKALEEGVK